MSDAAQLHETRPVNKTRSAEVGVDDVDGVRHELLGRLLDASLDVEAVSLLLEEPETAAQVVSVLHPIATAVVPTIDWLVVNARRVDAGVVSEDGREWRVVLETDDGRRVGAVWVFARPEPFEGVSGGVVVVINGPSGSGKSSLMAALAELAPTPWVVFDEPNVGSVQMPYLIWRATAPTLHVGFLRGIAGVASAGNQVVTSAGGHQMELLDRELGSSPLVKVGLDCPLSVLLQRERGRSGRWGGLAEASVGDHAGWTYDLRLDTSTTSPVEGATEVLALVEARRTDG